MKFGVFKMSSEKEDGRVVISFTALKNPANPKRVMELEAANAQMAAEEAGSLLKKLGVQTHTMTGDPDSVMESSADYFVGEIKTFRGDPSSTFRIHQFEPVKV